MIGFLSPDGTFTACAAYNHLKLAKMLTARHYGVTSANEVQCEKFLLSVGWIEFRSDEVIFAPEDSDCILSVSQKRRLFDWLQGLSCNYKQKEYLKDILRHDAFMCEGILSSM